MSTIVKGIVVITIPGNAHLFLCQMPVSMRKSFEGLSALVEQLFPNELLTGAFFIFLNRRKAHMKVLFWDRDGFVIYFKRLEKGSFIWKSEKNSLDRKEFLMILEGISFYKVQKRFKVD
jgi:transposase